jgi:hypothetical protein
VNGSSSSGISFASPTTKVTKADSISCNGPHEISLKNCPFLHHHHHRKLKKNKQTRELLPCNSEEERHQKQDKAN